MNREEKCCLHLHLHVIPWVCICYSFSPFSDCTAYNIHIHPGYLLLPSFRGLFELGSGHLLRTCVIGVRGVGSWVFETLSQERWSSNALPLLSIFVDFNSVRSDVNDLIIKLLREQEIQKERKEGRNGETCLHHELNGAEETLESAVGASVCEDIAEPCSAQMLATWTISENDMYLRDQRGTIADSQTHGQDESIAPGEWNGRDNANT